LFFLKEPIGEFTIRETDLTRDGVQRSQTFSNTEDVLSNKTNSDHRRNSLTNNDRKHEVKKNIDCCLQSKSMI